MSFVDFMNISVGGSDPTPSGGGKSDGRDDDKWDIDRWENDGGRSP